jgi:hypothetical protein
MYVVADDELHLGIFDTALNAPGELARMLPGELPLPATQRKRRKPDFESLLMLPASRARPHGALLALGSGSTSERYRGVIIPFSGDNTLSLAAAQSVDLTQLYESARARVGALNIEGAVATNDSFLLLQRGNKGDGINAVVRFDRAQVLAHLDGARDHLQPISTRRYELGKIRDVPFSFSDGTALADDSVVFTAIAEDTHDAYADGACAGAAIGMIDRSGDLRGFYHAAGGGKLEGVHAEATDSGIALLCVSDADDASVPASLYRGALPNP